MQSILVAIICLFAALVPAISTTGSRLLVVLDDVAEKANYKQFLGDLSGTHEFRNANRHRVSIDGLTDESIERGYQISYETPRSEKIKLFHLGERTYDHLVFLPARVKGKIRSRAPISLCSSLQLKQRLVQI